MFKNLRITVKLSGDFLFLTFIAVLMMNLSCNALILHDFKIHKTSVDDDGINFSLSSGKYEGFKVDLGRDEACSNPIISYYTRDSALKFWGKFLPGNYFICATGFGQSFDRMSSTTSSCGPKRSSFKGKTKKASNNGHLVTIEGRLVEYTIKETLPFTKVTQNPVMFEKFQDYLLAHGVGQIYSSSQQELVFSSDNRVIIFDKDESSKWVLDIDESTNTMILRELSQSGLTDVLTRPLNQEPLGLYVDQGTIHEVYRLNEIVSYSATDILTQVSEVLILEQLPVKFLNSVISTMVVRDRKIIDLALTAGYDLGLQQAFEFEGRGIQGEVLGIINNIAYSGYVWDLDRIIPYTSPATFCSRLTVGSSDPKRTIYHTDLETLATTLFIGNSIKGEDYKEKPGIRIRKDPDNLYIKQFPGGILPIINSSDSVAIGAEQIFITDLSTQDIP